MHINKITGLIRDFLSNRAGDTTLSIAIFFSIAVVFTAIMAVPVLDKTSREYAENKSYGVDTITTSSVNKPDNSNTYIMRRSIFDKGLKKICKSSDVGNC